MSADTSTRDYDSARDSDQTLPTEAAQDIALRKLLYQLADLDDNEEIGLIEAALRVADRIDTLEARVEKLTPQSQSGRANGQTKVNLAYEIAREEGVRVSSKGIGGGMVDWPTVRDIADRRYNTTLNSGTVYKAFDRLADDWQCFTVERGGDGPNTKNKRLTCDRDGITENLRATVSNEPN